MTVLEKDGKVVRNVKVITMGGKKYYLPMTQNGEYTQNAIDMLMKAGYSVYDPGDMKADEIAEMRDIAIRRLDKAMAESVAFKLEGVLYEVSKEEISSLWSRLGEITDPETPVEIHCQSGDIVTLDAPSAAYLTNVLDDQFDTAIETYNEGMKKIRRLRSVKSLKEYAPPAFPAYLNFDE